MSKVYVVIPAKNEASRIGMVIYHTRLQGFENIIVVDDGSTDATSSIALRFGATVLYHQINLGAGAATQTGIEYALEQGADPVHLGIVLCFNLCIGLVSPPMGGCLLVVSTVTGVNYWQLARAVIPFVLVQIAVLALLIQVPAISLALPRAFGLAGG